ncbi:hypothetical protein J2P12_06160 [Candidatus Bathyarchaeota archaeon]|nr:hypothetical protein [Candidatus Bathyarchaeota archaeon]
MLMYYWVETAFENALGIVPPYYGTTTLQANVVGLDLSYYQAPSVTATFNLPYYLGFLSLGLVLGRSFVTFLQQRGIPAINSLLSGTGIRDIYLSPPYHQVWFSSEDAQFNPMQRNPETMKDDEILVSFERLFETVEPGGSLLVILPDWATGLADRLEVLLPQTGFTLEKTTLVSRTSGKSENELRFRKPIVKPVATADLISPTEQSSTPEFQQLGGQGAEPKTDQSNNPPESIQSSFAAETPPPVSETAQAFAWVQTRMTKLERSMLKVAIQIISERRQPVPYRELLNQVYMDLVDHKIEFDSARQIETTLLQHNGKELSLLEEGDNNGIRPIKKWWLGDQKMSSDNSHGLPGVARIREVGPKLQRIRERFLKSKPRYSSKKDDESDSDHLDS